MRLYFDTTQLNYIKRLPKITKTDALYVVCASPITTFDENEYRTFLIATLSLMF